MELLLVIIILSVLGLLCAGQEEKRGRADQRVANQRRVAISTLDSGLFWMVLKKRSWILICCRFVALQPNKTGIRLSKLAFFGLTDGRRSSEGRRRVGREREQERRKAHKQQPQKKKQIWSPGWVFRTTVSFVSVVCLFVCSVGLSVCHQTRREEQEEKGRKLRFEGIVPGVITITANTSSITEKKKKKKKKKKRRRSRFLIGKRIRWLFRWTAEKKAGGAKERLKMRSKTGWSNG